jgi:hypothetical protein
MGIFLDCQGDILDGFDLLATGISCEIEANSNKI